MTTEGTPSLLTWAAPASVPPLEKKYWYGILWVSAVSQQELTHTTMGDVAWVLPPAEKPPLTVKLVLVAIRIGWRTVYSDEGIWLVAMNAPLAPRKPTSS